MGNRKIFWKISADLHPPANCNYFYLSRIIRRTEHKRSKGYDFETPRLFTFQILKLTNGIGIISDEWTPIGVSTGSR